MKKNFTPIAIGFLQNEQEVFMANVERKYRLFKELIEYVNTFIQVDDITCFKTEIATKCIEGIIAKYKSEFPPSISDLKLLELIEVDTAKIQYLSNEFESIDVDIDLKTGQPNNTPDFNIYTSSEDENKLYKYLSKTIQVIEEGKDLGINIYPANLCQAFYGWISYDWSKGGLIPNITRIQNRERALG